MIDKDNNKLIHKNQVILAGEIVSQPQLIKTVDGRDLTVLSLATNNYFRCAATSEVMEITEFHRILFFAKLAKKVLSLKLSSILQIHGRLRQSDWKDDYGLSASVSEIWADKYKVLVNVSNVVNFNGGSRL